MSIDEAIAHEKEVAKEIYVEAMLCHANPDDGKLDDCIERGKYHEHLAEWLEELKAIKSDGFTDDLLNMGFKKGYSKALNDVESEFLMCYKVHYNLQDILCVINKLKEGASDGNG